MDLVDDNKELIRPLKREKYRLSKRWSSSIRKSIENKKLVNGSNGFDLSHSRVCGFKRIRCNNGCLPLVVLYAKLGLHRYNLRQGKNLQFSSVKNYNQSSHSAACLYFITLEAMDPLTHSLLTFQTKLNENNYGKFDLSCIIARPLGETNTNNFEISICRNAVKNCLLMKFDLPEWPPDNPFENSKRCHVLNKSEVQDNDWIRLYLELAVATTNRCSSRNHDVSNLKILKVAIDTTTQDVVTHITIVYIRYKDSCEARVGKDVDRVAIVRRVYIEGTGYFRLMGKNLSSEIIPKKGKKQLLFSLRLKQLLLLSPRRLNACKYNGVGFSGKKRTMPFSSSPRRPKKAYKNSGPGYETK